MAPPPPVIEGTLKNTINSLGFGLITTVLSVTFGKMLIPKFFVWIVGFVVFIEAALLSIPRKAEEYELYQGPGKKVTHNIEGSGAPQISINTPDDEDFRKKKAGLRERFKKDKHGKKDLLRPEAAEVGETSRHSGHGNTSSPKRSPKMERKAKEESHKAEKETVKAEKAAEKAEKEKSEKTKDKSKGKGESADSVAEEQEDAEKNKNKGKGGWKKRLPHRKSQSLSDD